MATTSYGTRATGLSETGAPTTLQPAVHIAVDGRDVQAALRVLQRAGVAVVVGPSRSQYALDGLRARYAADVSSTVAVTMAPSRPTVGGTFRVADADLTRMQAVATHAGAQLLGGGGGGGGGATVRTFMVADEELGRLDAIRRRVSQP